jgi:hypothetical protein
MKWEDVLKTVIWPILGLVLGVLLTWARPLIGNENFLIGTLTMLAFSLSLTTFYTSKLSNFLSTELAAKIDSLQKKISLLEQTVANSGAFDWILSRDQLMTIEQEKTSSCNEIWIVTPDLSTDTGDCPWANTVKENASQGITYRYICARTNGAEAAAAQLGDTFRLYPNRCFVAMITQDEYERFPNHHIVVYDPRNNNGMAESFAELETSKKGYWIRLTSARRNQVIDKAKEILANAKPIKEYMS